MNRKIPAILSFLFVYASLFSQTSWLSKRNKIVIPFELTHNLIIIETEVNDVKLNMLLDTGSDKNLLFSFPENDSILFYDTRKIKINGLGNGESLEAIISGENKLKVKDYLDEDFEVLLITDRDISLVNKLGVPINGIIGSSFFKDYLVEINYQSKKVILHKEHKKSITKKLRRYKSKKVEVIDGKPYLKMITNINDTKKIDLKLLMDTGLGDGLWLFENDSVKCGTLFFNELLGKGLGGDIEGKKSRVKKLELNELILKEALVSYPDTISFNQLDFVKGRNGSLGGEIIKRFNWILDYKNETFYFKKNTNFNDSFNYNMSGIEVQHAGSTWVSEKLNFSTFTNTNSKTFVYDKEHDFNYKFSLQPVFEIYSVRENSPAQLAGLKKGDMILSINGRKAYNYTIQKITNLFQSEEGKVIKMLIERGDTVIEVKFELEKLL
ncbi:PDZ domain-containing protein [Flavobacterium sp.]|uniref:PDZ domain-containing protein n=1 Tax=Flavobacterium sp. TaxID=239 RepID=UPI0040476B49